MSKYTDMSKELLNLIGGKDNVASATHCATRLRIRLRDEDNVPVEEIKKLPGVLGLQKNVGEIQVIIGPAVDDAYQEFVKIGGFESKAEKKNVSAQKREKGFKAVMNTLFSAMTGCISPIVYAFVVMGMFKSISAIFGPNLLGLFTAESDVYVLLEGIGNAITYFLPFLLAYSASQKLGANTVVSIVKRHCRLLLRPDPHCCGRYDVWPSGGWPLPSILWCVYCQHGQRCYLSGRSVCAGIGRYAGVL